MFPFWKLDSDSDGLLTASEFHQVAAPRLENAPPEELRKSIQDGEAVFAGIDADGDKRINAKEHYTYHSGIWAGISALRKLFEIADTNKDMQVSADELVECR